MSRIYALPDVATPVDENYYLVVDDSTLATPEKITITDLTAQSEARATAVATGAITGAGLDAGTGVYTPDETSNYLTSKEFAGAGLTASLFSADLLLDAKIKATQNIGSKYYALTVTSSQILNMKGSNIIALPTPGAGYINHVKRVFYKLNFATTAYTLPGAGEFRLAYNSGTQSLGSISSTYLSSGSQPQPAVSNNYVAGVEMYANEAVYLESTFGGELTLGDSTLSVIVEYETFADFSVPSVPPVQLSCLQSYSSTFTNASLTGLGNLEINHNLNTTDILSLVIVDDKNAQNASVFNLGDQTGANTANIITVPIGLGISGTWSFAIIVNIC